MFEIATLKMQGKRLSHTEEKRKATTWMTIPTFSRIRSFHDFELGRPRRGTLAIVISQRDADILRSALLRSVC